MIISQDLRIAIKAAANAQPPDNSEARILREQKAIAEFFKKFPKKAKRLRQLAASVDRHEKAISDARREICQSGLRRDNEKQTGFEFAYCGDGGSVAFAKAGGNYPKHVRYTADQMLAMIAAATPDDGKKLIKQFGICWE